MDQVSEDWFEKKFKKIMEAQDRLTEKQEKLTVSQAQTDKQMKDTDNQLKELGKQIGGLGDKFGSFTEGMAFPSLEKMLRERFGMDVIGTRIKSRKNGRIMELDVFAYSNSGTNQVFIIEVKSHLREEGLEQMLQMLHAFSEFFPEHKSKQLFGILACVDSPELLEKKVMDSGIYLAKIYDETFELQVPENFTPQSFQ